MAPPVQLTNEQRQLILEHVDDMPCILCDEQAHCATNPCPNLNLPPPKGTWTRRYFQSRAAAFEAREFVRDVIKDRWLAEAAKKRADEAADPVVESAISSTTPTIPDMVPVTGSSKDVESAPIAGQQQISDTQSLTKVQDVLRDEEVESTLPKALVASKDLATPGLQFNPSTNIPTVGHAKFPARKNFGVSHRDVLTNHFEVTFEPETPIFVYRIEGIPAGKTKRKTKAIVKAAIQAWDFLYKNEAYFATDFLTKIVSWKNLHESIELPPDATGTTWRPANIVDGETEISSLVFKLEKEIRVKDLEDYANPDKAPDRQDLPSLKYEGIVDVLNIAISKSLTNGVVQLSSNKFFVKAGYERLSKSLCTMRGYYYTLKPGMGKVLLNVNTATSAFFRPIMVDVFMADEDTFLETDRAAKLRKLRVFIEYDRLAPTDDRDKAHCDHLNKRQNRVKTVYDLGLPISNYSFKKFSRRDDDTWHEDPQATKVVDHLQKGNVTHT